MYVTDYQSAIGLLAVVFGTIAIVGTILGIVMYIFESIGLYSISRRRKLGTSGFAWIPILRLFKFGQIADDAVLHKRGTKSHFMVLMPVFHIAGMVICCVGGFLLLLACNVQINDLGNLFRGGFTYEIAPGGIPMESLIVGGIIFFVGYILVLIASVMAYICYYHVYKSLTGKYVVFFVLSLIFSVTIPFFIFALRHKTNPEFYKEVPPVPEEA